MLFASTLIAVSVCEMKAPCPMDSTDAGRSMVASVQFQNARSSMDLRPLPRMSTVESLRQLKNAPLPMDSTVSGMMIDVMPRKPLNDSPAMEDTVPVTVCLVPSTVTSMPSMVEGICTVTPLPPRYFTISYLPSPKLLYS